MSAERPVPGPIQILVAEDSPTQAQRLIYILEKRDYQVRWVRTGADGGLGPSPSRTAAVGVSRLFLGC